MREERREDKRHRRESGYAQSMMYASKEMSAKIHQFVQLICVNNYNKNSSTLSFEKC